MQGRRIILVRRHILVTTIGKEKQCIVDGIGHSRNFLEETLEEPGFTTRACTQVGEPDLVLSGLPPVTP
jgi:hypothetical protein